MSDVIIHITSLTSAAVKVISGVTWECWNPARGKKEKRKKNPLTMNKHTQLMKYCYFYCCPAWRHIFHTFSGGKLYLSLRF